MRVFKYNSYDAILVFLSILEVCSTFFLATHWEGFSVLGAFGSFALLVLMMVYNIIIISHLFTHTPWFNSSRLNALVSMLNSFNIGQSVQLYHLSHVRNHHRYNNDQQGPDGKTKDTSSTFQDGKNGEHANLFQYAFIGAALSVYKAGFELLSVFRGFRVGAYEKNVLNWLSRNPEKRRTELQQIILDRFAYFTGICIFLLLSWKWTLLCYLPAYYLALALVNIQNYYEHFGAMPGQNAADSVSYYGRIYNWFTFNDGHHQEHHLKPAAHWSTLPNVRKTHHNELTAQPRIISSVPAIVGFLDRNRNLLHRDTIEQNIACQTVSNGADYE